MNIGTYQRSTPRIRVPRGYNPQQPFGLKAAYPVATGVTIKSGQVISPKKNVSTLILEWVLGKDSDASVVYFAINDSADFDVIAAGTLPALSSEGEYEIETNFFKRGDAYVDGAAVTADGVTGNLKLAVAGSPIFGRVIGVGPFDISGEDSAVVDGDGAVLVLRISTSKGAIPA